MNEIKVAYGVFSWDGEERRSDRYGAIAIDSTIYGGDRVCDSSVDKEALSRLVGKRVRLIAVVREARKSGHCGDLAHGIFPSMPAVGERIELGVGELRLDSVAWSHTHTIKLRPYDGRRVFWMDPRLLYRLHDQTVDLFVEVTADPPHAAPNIGAVEEGAFVTDDDGSGARLQIKHIDPNKVKIRVEPTIERVGDGLFIVSSPKFEVGRRVAVSIDGRRVPGEEE